MRIAPATALEGHVGVPGDAWISQLALVLGCVAEGETRVVRVSEAPGVEATMRAVAAEVVGDGEEILVRGGRPPIGERIDCHQAPLLAALLAGALAGAEGQWTLAGDIAELRRAADVLRRLGADTHPTDGELTIGGARLRGAELRVADTAAKIAALLAATRAEGATTVLEERPLPDHAELMLDAAGVRVVRRPASITVEPAARLSLPRIEIPGDFSLAAPLVVASTLLPGSELTVHGVGLNPRRTRLLDALERMGARVAVYARRRFGSEPVGDLEVRAAELTASDVDAAEAAMLGDDLPQLVLALAMAHGDSIVRAPAPAALDALRAIGARAARLERGLGFRVRGVPTRPRGGSVDAGGDPAIALLGLVGGLVSREGVDLLGADAAALSFPGFFELVDAVARRA